MDESSMAVSNTASPGSQSKSSPRQIRDWSNATIQKISISSYGCLLDVAWSTNSSCILITGPSRVGKTTILQALHLACHWSDAHGQLWDYKQAPASLSIDSEFQFSYNISHEQFLLHLRFNRNRDGDYIPNMLKPLPHLLRSCLVSPNVPTALDVPETYKEVFDHRTSRDMTLKVLLLLSISVPHYSAVVLLMNELFSDTKIAWSIHHQLEGYQPIFVRRLVCITATGPNQKQQKRKLADESRVFLITLNLLLDIMLEMVIIGEPGVLDVWGAVKQAPSSSFDWSQIPLANPKQGLVVLLLLDTLDVHPNLLTPSFWKSFSSRFSKCCILTVAGASKLPNNEALWEWGICPINNGGSVEDSCGESVR